MEVLLNKEEQSTKKDSVLSQTMGRGKSRRKYIPDFVTMYKLMKELKIYFILTLSSLLSPIAILFGVGPKSEM